MGLRRSKNRRLFLRYCDLFYYGIVLLRVCALGRYFASYMIMEIFLMWIYSVFFLYVCVILKGLSLGLSFKFFEYLRFEFELKYFANLLQILKKII